jgi:hypothetical protein
MAVRPYVAWEYRHQIGRLNALFLTWRQTLFSPRRFFHGVPIGGNYRSPLFYGLFWTLLGSAGGVGWKLLLFIYPTVIDFFGGEMVQVSFQLTRTYVFVTVLSSFPAFRAASALAGLRNLPCIRHVVYAPAWRL